MLVPLLLMKAPKQPVSAETHGKTTGLATGFLPIGLQALAGTAFPDERGGCVTACRSPLSGQFLLAVAVQYCKGLAGGQGRAGRCPAGQLPSACHRWEM